MEDCKNRRLQYTSCQCPVPSAQWQPRRPLAGRRRRDAFGGQMVFPAHSSPMMERNRLFSRKSFPKCLYTVVPRSRPRGEIPPPAATPCTHTHTPDHHTPGFQPTTTIRGFITHHSSKKFKKVQNQKPAFQGRKCSVRVCVCACVLVYGCACTVRPDTNRSTHYGYV